MEDNILYLIKYRDYDLEARRVEFWAIVTQRQIVYSNGQLLYQTSLPTGQWDMSLIEFCVPIEGHQAVLLCTSFDLLSLEEAGIAQKS